MVSSEGLRKAAILIVSLDTETACNLMAHLDKDTIERMTFEIARLDDVSNEERDRTVEEFYTIVMARQYIERGGLHYAQELLEKTLPTDEAKAIIDQVRLSLEATPFSFLRKTPSETLATFLSDEHPQTIALVLAHLLPRQASDLIKSLSPEKQLEVTRRIANMEQTSPEVVREVERSLQKRLSSVIGEDLEQLGGASTVAEILNYTDRTTEKAILENLEAEDPELVEEVRRLMFVFEDVALVDQRGMQEVLKEIDNDTLALALKGTTQELREKFFAAMSKRAAELVQENMEFLGAVRVSEVERAQQEIVDVVRRLDEAGAIHLRKRGAEEEELVE
ncbi:Flagellar motor switch protein FliG [Planctomycetes bacterium Pan216]|uniref:Flagellar motor switch protein FliG n=1 Tax=Kolteria novifilia TaxID=2527975 RepID=A0A518BBN2_9BACT|nr:Flagellar motor switch protein FliG [Planctomycetes bacterium Pan216]